MHYSTAIVTSRRILKVFTSQDCLLPIDRASQLSSIYVVFRLTSVKLNILSPLNQKNPICLFFPTGSCSRTPRGLWTRAPASRLYTGRTAASCRTKTCSSCLLISGSTLVSVLLQRNLTPAPSFIHVFLHQAGEDGQTPGTPGQPGRDH